MVVLLTKQFTLQTDNLDLDDIVAAWTVTKVFKSSQMVIYNCGAGAGSSLGHKHLQIFSLLDIESTPLFPSRATSTTTMARSLSNVCLKHFVFRIPEAAQGAEFFKLYQSLLAESREACEDPTLDQTITSFSQQNGLPSSHAELQFGAVHMEPTGWHGGSGHGAKRAATTAMG